MSLMLLDKVRDSDVQSHPWPHVVVRNPLTDEECLQLIEEIPPLDQFSETKFTKRAFLHGKEQSNKRLQHLMSHIMAMDGLWPKLAVANTGLEYASKLFELFGEHLTVGDFRTLNHCRWRVEPGYDVGWTLNIGANTPVHGEASSVLPDPHIDAPTKMCFGLLYLRHPDDKSEGGDLLIYDGDKVAATVKYERNVFVLGINTPKSFHCVTSRQPTEHPRLFANLYAEVREPLFERP